MRKKLLICLLLCASLLLSLGVFAHAERQLDFVSDYAGLLSEEENRALNERAEAVYRQYGFPVYIVTVNDYHDYVASGGIEYFAEEVFHAYTLGEGESEDVRLFHRLFLFMGAAILPQIRRIRTTKL